MKHPVIHTCTLLSPAVFHLLISLSPFIPSFFIPTSVEHYWLSYHSPVSPCLLVLISRGFCKFAATVCFVLNKNKFYFLELIVSFCLLGQNLLKTVTAADSQTCQLLLSATGNNKYFVFFFISFAWLAAVVIFFPLIRRNSYFSF